MKGEHESVAARLAEFALRRRITVLVIFSTIVVVGVIATLGIPVELLPRGFTNSSLQVSVPWRNAPVREVLEKITIPLEDELATVKGLERTSSFTSKNNASVFLTFKQGVDMDVAYREVRDRVERARALFPADADRTFIRKNDASGIPVAVIGLSIDPTLTDIYNLIQREVVVPFQRLDGVATVDVNGLEQKEVIIEINRQLLESHGLNIYELSQELGGDNFTMASGRVHENGKKFLLRSVARYDNLEALENRPISQRVRLKDVAVVRYEEPEKNYSVRVNGQPAFAVMIKKEGEANTIEVSKRIEATMAEMGKNPRLRQVFMLPLFIQGDLIRSSLDNVISSGRLGALFAVLVLFFFLRRFRLTGIITLSIPLSMIMALVVMYFSGETLNILSLLALVISIGLLVDNSVVVAENIHRRHQEGLSLRDACIQGAGEIGLAITMATLTTVVVFLSVSLVKGQIQFFLLRIAIPITVSLLASLLVALVFIPLCTYLTLNEKNGAAPTTGWRGGFNHAMKSAYEASFGRFNRAYARLLAIFLKWRLDLILLLALVMAITVAVAFKHVKIRPQDENNESEFNIQVELPRDTTFAEAKAFFKECEKVIESKRAELHLDYYFIFHRTLLGNIRGSLVNDDSIDITPRQAAIALNEVLPKKPGVKYFLGEESPDSEKDSGPVFSLIVQGDDLDQLETTVKGIEALLLRVDGVAGPRKTEDPPPNEMALVIDRERVQQVGVSSQTIAGVVGFALRGSGLPRYREDGREIPVRIRFREEDRESLDDLGGFFVPSQAGEVLPLSALTNVTMLNSPATIFRRNKRISRSVAVELHPDKADQTRKTLIEMAAQLDLPEGISLGEPSQRQSDQEDVKNLAIAFLLAIIFIYLLMGFLFESFILPLSIIATIPLALIGVGWVHYLAGLNIDFLGGIGLVLLIGVVVNNGIVLIDYVIRLRARGMARTEAILTAAQRRFRPIAMTALTTICGMIPLTFADRPRMGLDYTSFGLTLIGGMTTATLLTLLVVPVFYTMFDDARLAMRKALHLGAQSPAGSRPRFWRKPKPVTE